ncbi:hypothetical protein [Achromobacter aegrifaciens]|uniref:Uncharacterized protein n=1 Tax=Achromobacter aegrifaciens TaxID=1287736 RepID=A0ABU2D8V7_ACHAE|nr:hypothetical protein [Achromobacter aegrifaciens]MDR7944545.1 hypothetical protein [Achromobacter aegrifaciens]
MSDICQVKHQVVLRVDKLLGMSGAAASVDVDVYALAPGDRRVKVHTERFIGKVRTSGYVRTVSVWIDTVFGPVSDFELICRPESGANVEVALVNG